MDEQIIPEQIIDLRSTFIWVKLSTSILSFAKKKKKQNLTLHAR